MGRRGVGHYSKSRGLYYCYGKVQENRKLGTGFLVPHRTV
jgi:hypothetical protein